LTYVTSHNAWLQSTWARDARRTVMLLSGCSGSFRTALIVPR
jgi:hypothetical protein